MDNKNTSQNFIPIENIHDDVVVLKNGQMCMILLATSINFALKSSEEQQAILSQFQSFLNSIDFSLQIYIQSRRFDINPYLKILQERENIQNNELMRIQLREYTEFVATFTDQVDIMKKNFFVVIPYTPINLEVGGIKKILSVSEKKSNDVNDRFFEDRTQLELRVSAIEQGLERIGIHVAPLSNNQLIDMYYRIFNPEDTMSPQTNNDTL